MKFSIFNFQFSILTVLIFILNLSFIIYHSPKAFAESISLGVNPPIFQIQAVPPANILSPLTIENRGDSGLNLSVSFKPFVPTDREDGQIKYVKEEVGVDVKLLDESGQSVSEVELSPKQKKNFNLSINLPSDAKSSDYYFSVIFLASDTLNTSDTLNSSKTQAGIAANVLLSVGSGPVSGEISEFSAPLFIERGPVPLTVRIKNRSNHFINPKGEILIKNIFGQTIGRVDLAQVNILADSVRNIPSEDYFDEGKNLPDNLAAYWPQNFILGPYKVSLSIALSDTGPLFKRSIFFFAFPLKETIAVLIGVIVLTYITVRVRRKV